MFMVWFERKIIAGMQNRVGPNKAGPFGILQTLADGMKLIFKEDFLPDRADRSVYRLAPFLAFVPAFLVWSVIPLGGDFTRRQRRHRHVVRPRHAGAARRPADRHPAGAGAVVDRRLRHHARRLVERLEVPAARRGAGVGADDLATRPRSGSASPPCCWSRARCRPPASSTSRTRCRQLAHRRHRLRAVRRSS